MSYILWQKPQSSKARAILWFSLFALLAPLFSGCQSSREVVLDGLIMGTSYQVKIRQVPKNTTDNELNLAVSAELNRMNRIFSTYLKSSELSQLNQLEVGASVQMSDDLCNVFNLSASVNKMTLGAFNPTVAPVVNVWGFGPNEVNANPSKQTIDEALSKTGMDRVAIDKCKLTKLKPVSYDFSAIAKGYAVDKVSSLLTKMNLPYHLVEIGGEIKASIPSSSESVRSWFIGIEKPETTGARKAVAAIDLTNQSVATSGDYRNYKEVDGKRYSHTIDPNTGYPVSHALASVTVITDDCATADALATGLNVLGPERAMQVAEQNKLAIYTVVHREGQFDLAFSSEFKTFLSN